MLEINVSGVSSEHIITPEIEVYQYFEDLSPALQELSPEKTEYLNTRPN